MPRKSVLSKNSCPRILANEEENSLETGNTLEDEGTGNYAKRTWSEGEASSSESENNSHCSETEAKDLV